MQRSGSYQHDLNPPGIVELDKRIAGTLSVTSRICICIILGLLQTSWSFGSYDTIMGLVAECTKVTTG